MKKNITLTLEERLIKKLRHISVENDMSLSAWVSLRLEDIAREDERTAESRLRALEKIRTGYDLGGTPLSRKDIYDR